MKQKSEKNLEKKKLIKHLEDLRNILIKTFIIFFIFFVISYLTVSSKILYFFMKRIQFIQISPIDLPLTQLIISSYLSLLIILPYCLIKFKEFLKPASYESTLVEKLTQNISYVIFLFYISFSFTFVLFYYILKIILLPIAIREFFSWFIRVHFYLFISMIIILLFNISRRVFYVLSFILGAIFTPPDVMSQITFALILITFYEISNVIKQIKKNFKKKSLLG